MKIFEVYFDSSYSSGVDTVVCNDESEVNNCLTERGHRNVEIQSCIEINPQRVRVKNLTVGDLIKLIKN